jgi:hypothetical protein
MTYESWCPEAKRMAVLMGEIVGKCQAEILRVSDCVVQNCVRRGSPS